MIFFLATLQFRFWPFRPVETEANLRLLSRNNRCLRSFGCPSTTFGFPSGQAVLFSRLCCHQRRRLTQLPWQICSRHILPDYHPLFWIFPIVFIWTRREKQSPNACATLEPESIYRQKLRITRGQVPMGFPSVMNGADLVWMAVLSHCFFSPGYAEHAQ